MRRIRPENRRLREERDIVCTNQRPGRPGRSHRGDLPPGEVSRFMRAANQAQLRIVTRARTFGSLRELASRFRLLRKLALYYVRRRPRRGTGNPVVPNLSSTGCILLGTLGSKLAIAVPKVIDARGVIERSPIAARGGAESFKGASV